MSRTLLYEIGTEEVPSAPLYGAVEQLRTKGPEALRAARLAFTDVSVMATPRRLALIVNGLAEEQPDLEEKVRGPSVTHAFDANGEPTRAATGFATSRGVAVEDLVREAEGDQEYVYALVREDGRTAAEVLPDVLSELTASLDWPKSMRWDGGGERFSRPIRWLTCVFGADVIPVEYAGLTASDRSMGHRFLSDGSVEVPVADEYSRAMERANVLVDLGERTILVRESVEAAAEKADATAVIQDKTFREVVNLVEWPTAALGTFDREFLRVPREVLQSAMESHQRYFPVENEDGELLPHFVVVHNGPPELTDSIVEGHERVIRARLADAAFFFDEDLKVSLEEHVHRLETIVFQERLGTVAQRVDRVEALTQAIATQVGAEPDDAAWASRAAHLSKADLVTNMVVEFPTLQGVMGRHYALAGDEAPEVADAILEHYRPRFAGDDLPASTPGALVSLADKLDTIVGIFGVGMPPTGSADPYALRRAALGVLGIIIDSDVQLGLDDAIASALFGLDDVLPDLDKESVGSQVKEFILGRMETVLKERGHAYDTVAAVLAVAADDPADATARADALTALRADEALEDLWVAYSRAKNLSDPALGTATDVSFMVEEERALEEALASAEVTAGKAMDSAEYESALETLSALRAPIDVFFDEVLVMDEEPALRENRLRLLNRFVALFSRYADFSKLAE